MQAVSPSATIYALSSGAPPAGIAVVRISGPATRFALETMVGRLPRPREATVRSIRNHNGLLIDTGLVLFFEQGRSFTGEDSAEFHVHGGRAVVACLLDALSKIDDLRHAEAGEFTWRAFENGRIDLMSVEGLADLVQAQTEMQRRLALEQTKNGLRSLYEGWAERLTGCRAWIEATFDFSDEGDVPDDLPPAVWEEIAEIRDAIAAHLKRAHAAEVVRDGYQVVIVGPPNAGKSSLMNALMRRDVSIVSETPGTTRDIVSVTMDLGGHAVVIRDTAGLRETSENIEREGIRRAVDAAADADLVLHLSDLASSATALPETGYVAAGTVLHVGTKSDLVPGNEIDGDPDRVISTVTGHGIDALLADIEELAATAAGDLGQALPARLRHRQHLVEAQGHIETASARRDLPLEIRAEELRSAAFALGRITGQVDVEEVLGVIFSQFCVGK